MVVHAVHRVIDDVTPVTDELVILTRIQNCVICLGTPLELLSEATLSLVEMSVDTMDGVILATTSVAHRDLSFFTVETEVVLLDDNLSF